MYYANHTYSPRSHISKGLSHMPTLIWLGKEDALRSAYLVPLRLFSKDAVRIIRIINLDDSQE